MPISWRFKTLYLLVLCVAELTSSSYATGQTPVQTAAANRVAAARAEQKIAAQTPLQIDGCLTSEGLMPKLTLFRSSKVYRLETGPMLLTEHPLTFANNINALVHVTGVLGPEADIYDADHAPVFIVHTIDKLAPTCDTNVSITQLRKQLEKSKVPLAQAEAASGAHVVDMKGELLVFLPKNIQIKAGQTVTWTNSSERELHTVTADPALATNAKDVKLPKGAKPFDSGYLNPGQTYKHTFTTPGTYQYVCTLHEVQGMIGTVVVKP